MHQGVQIHHMSVDEQGDDCMITTIWEFALLGAATGALYVLGALGLVLTYRGSAVVNFALGIMGMAGAFCYWELHDIFHWPMAIAMIIGIAASGLLGWANHLLMLPLRQASNLTRIIVTLDVLVVLQGLLALKYPETNTYTVQAILPHGAVTVFGATVGEDRLWLIAIAVVLTAVISVFYKYSRIGLATTAVSENQAAIATLGWSPNAIAGANWAVGAALAGLAAILLSPVTGLSVGLATSLLLPGLAAAVIGNLRSFPLTLVGGLGIGIVQSELQRYVTVQGIGDAVPFAAIIVIVVLRGSAMPLRGAVAERLPAVTSGYIPFKRVIGWTIIVIALFVVLPTGWVGALTFTVVGAVVLESLVVTTGFAGQISLAQWAIGGCGALVMSWLRVWGLPFELAVLLGVLAAIPIGLVVGSAALRARGLSLAIATLAFGVCIVSLVLSNYSINGGASGLNIGAFEIFGLHLDAQQHPRRFGVFCLIVLVLIGLAIANTRRGRTGRRILAVRANERAAAALGLNVVGIKLAAFCYGAMIAAFGGIVSILAFENAQFVTFDVFTNIQLITYSVLGGVGFIVGPFFGAQSWPGGITSQIFSYVSTNAQQYVIVAVGVLTLFVIIRAPDGLARFQSLQHQKTMGGLRKLLRRRPQPPRTMNIDLTAVVPGREAVVTPVELAVDELVVAFGGVRAVNRVSFALHGGEVLGLIGPNGAGKTTLIDAITGFTPLTSGKISVDGRSIGRLSPRRRAAVGLGRSFQSLELFEDLNVYENLLAACEPRDIGSWLIDLVHPRQPQLIEAAVTAIRDLGLEEYLGQLPGELPYGVRRLVVIARAIAAQPRVLCLDEPAAGLDEHDRVELVAIIRRLAVERGMAILLIEHDVALVSAASDRMIAIDFGTVVATGTPSEVREDPAVVSSYLGVEDDAGADGSSEVDDSAGDPSGLIHVLGPPGADDGRVAATPGSRRGQGGGM
jgi:ABC-type branched-subunit amino acid transport system ATPase component/branched-subunit amino acid ABC-type transport system permease component